MLNLLITLFICTMFQFPFIKIIESSMLLESGIFICIGALSLFQRKLKYEKDSFISKFDFKLLIAGFFLLFLIIIIDVVTSIF